MPEACGSESINAPCPAAQTWSSSKHVSLFLLTETSGTAGAFLSGEKNYHTIGPRRYPGTAREIDAIFGAFGEIVGTSFVCGNTK
jgi:hypothetical protein